MKSLMLAIATITMLALPGFVEARHYHGGHHYYGRYHHVGVSGYRPAPFYQGFNGHTVYYRPRNPWVYRPYPVYTGDPYSPYSGGYYFNRYGPTFPFEMYAPTNPDYMPDGP